MVVVLALLVALVAIGLPAIAQADELTEIVQKDLVALGYDPGNIDGEMSTETAIAISAFQAEHGLDVTGKPTPQLAGIIKSTIKNRNNPSGATYTQASAAPATDPAALDAARQACLQEKIQAAQASQQKKRGFGSLMRAVGRTASRLGGDAAQDIAQASRDIYDVNATASDLESAAKDLGLTESDIEACRNPAM